MCLLWAFTLCLGLGYTLLVNTQAPAALVFALKMLCSRFHRSGRHMPECPVRPCQCTRLAPLNVALTLKLPLHKSALGVERPGGSRRRPPAPSARRCWLRARTRGCLHLHRTPRRAAPRRAAPRRPLSSCDTVIGAGAPSAACQRAEPARARFATPSLCTARRTFWRGRVAAGRWYG